MGNNTTIYYCIILLLLVHSTSIPNIHIDTKPNNDFYILISSSGKICLKNHNNDIIWEKHLNQPLISTNININAIDFNQTNVLPGEEGRLYLINSDQDKYQPLNVSIRDIVLQSPMSFPWLQSKVFYGAIRKTKQYVDMTNGLISDEGNNGSILDFQTTNKTFAILRTDYIVELRNSQLDNIIEWNATVSSLEVTSVDNKLQYSKDSLTPIDWNMLYLNQKEYWYVYKYEERTDLFIKMSSSNSNRNRNYNNNDYVVNNKDENDLNDVNGYDESNVVLNSTYWNVIFLISALVIILFSWRIRRLSHKIKAVKAVGVIKESSNAKDKEGIVDDNDDNVSQLSTKSVMNKSIDEMHRRFSQSISPQISLSLSLMHRGSAPESANKYKEREEREGDGKTIESQSSNGNDELLSPQKTYQMKVIIEKKPQTIEKPKSAPPLLINKYIPSSTFIRKTSETLSMPKKKYKPTPSEQSELQNQIEKYLDSISTNDEYSSLVRQSNSINAKYNQIYRIINKSPNEDNEDEESNCNRIRNNRDMRHNNNNNNNNKANILLDFKGQSNLSLCDSGRFVNSFDNIQLIGKGGFGSVFKAMHKIDGSTYAIKVIKFNIELNEDLSKINEVKEIKTMMKLNCSNIVRYITCWFEFEDTNYGNNRGRSLSMDEKKEASSIPHNKRSQLPLNNNNNKVITNGNTLQSNNSDFELVINETSIDKLGAISPGNDNDYFKPSFNNNKGDQYRYNDEEDFSDNNSQYDNIVFGSDEDEEEDDDNYPDSFKNFNNNNQVKHKRKLSEDIQRHSERKQSKMKFPIYFFMQMEYCKGFSLSYYLQIQQHPLPEKIIIHFFNQLTNAVKVIHSRQIIHRDLKPANIFIKPNFKLKIGDFGLAAEMNQYSSKERVGTFLYQSPEQIEGKTYNEKVDIYALGLILLEMCLLFKTDSERHYVLKGIKKSQYPDELKQYPNEYSLIKLMTSANPANRPNIASIINSYQMLDLLDKL